jgi:hypothetical protein
VRPLLALEQRNTHAERDQNRRDQGRDGTLHVCKGRSDHKPIYSLAKQRLRIWQARGRPKCCGLLYWPDVLEGIFIEPTRLKPGPTPALDVTPPRRKAKDAGLSRILTTRASINPLQYVLGRRRTRLPALSFSG